MQEVGLPLEALSHSLHTWKDPGLGQHLCYLLCSLEEQCLPQHSGSCDTGACGPAPCPVPWGGHLGTQAVVWCGGSKLFLRVSVLISPMYGDTRKLNLERDNPDFLPMSHGRPQVLPACLLCPAVNSSLIVPGFSEEHM